PDARDEDGGGPRTEAAEPRDERASPGRCGDEWDAEEPPGAPRPIEERALERGVAEVERQERTHRARPVRAPRGVRHFTLYEIDARRGQPVAGLLRPVDEIGLARDRRAVDRLDDVAFLEAALADERVAAERGDLQPLDVAFGVFLEPDGVQDVVPAVDDLLLL